MRQVSEWLKHLGMSQYAQRFAENDIDFYVLHDLTDQDLEKIGVTSLGHHRRLLRAIANLEPQTASATMLTLRRHWVGPRARLPSAAKSAVQHAITVHGHEDTQDLRAMIRTAMRDGTPPVEAPRRAA